MADHKSKADFNAMSVAELKNIYWNGGLQRADTWKPPPQSKNGSASESEFRKGDTTPLGEWIIHDMSIPNPFFLKTVNNVNASQPFGLYEIFNCLICSPERIAGSMLRIKRTLATAYSSVDLPVLRSSFRGFLATDSPRQTFLHLSLSVSRS